MTELKEEIAKITKRIQNIKQGSGADKKVLDELNEKRRVLYNQLFDYKAVKVGEKVFNLANKFSSVVGKARPNYTKYTLFS